MQGQSLRRKYVGQFFGLARYSSGMAWTILGTYVGLILVSIWFGNRLLLASPTPSSVVLMSATSIFIGTRLRGINNIIHECCHSTFARERKTNLMIGRVCAALLMKTFRKYRNDHLSHHAYNGDYENDAEFAVIKKFALHEALVFRCIVRHIITPLTGRHLPAYTGINLSSEDGRLFVLFKIIIILQITLFSFFAPASSLLFIILPLFYIYPTLNYWTDCMDHAGLVGAADELKASRNILAPTLLRLLFFPRNDTYHLVHHLFPQVPARHLHHVHHELCKDTDYQN
jgi:fatty acid desaturase